MNITVNRQNNYAYELLLDDLVREVFGFSFAPWFERKLWDERYESYSIIQDGRMLANACIYKADLLINGQNIRAHQFGSIATRKNKRGEGFSRLLMEHILSLYPTVPAFLFANPHVIDFYPRFGFRQVQTYSPSVAVAIDNAPGAAVQYNADDDFVRNMLQKRRVYSKMVDSTNMQPVEMFHLLLGYAGGIYYLPGCDALIVAMQKDDSLFLADVVTQKPITFDELIRELPFKGVKLVEFGFCPDWLGVNPCWEPTDGSEDPFFVMGDWKLPEVFCFPVMSVT